jgi:SNF2 family DNA or RNA helicase
MVVLDEAHTIKNSETRIAEAANQLRARHRLALTGTPVENRAAELWSIINWLNPGYLGGQADFSAYTTLARSSEQKAALLAPLRECLLPIILRRLKSDPRIALGLPDKVHLDLCCELSDEQTALYEAVIETVLAEADTGLKPFVRRSVFLKAILHLKQICLHPDLFYGEHDEDDLVTEIGAGAVAPARKIRQLVVQRLRQTTRGSTHDTWLARSSKLRAVRDLIDSLRLSSQGILIFTQYLGAADLLRRTLAHSHHAAIPFIHGGLSSAERLELVDEFNESCRLRGDSEPCPILILSLKAGGTGLNLTGADRVIHFDRWWNPAVEDQATDRAHRIGQNRTVFTHTVTCQSTIEEAIGRIFEVKRQLAEDLLGAAASDDLGELLRDNNGFLDLVDPQRLFSQRLAGTSPSQPKLR